jgi:hypothetical protein
MSDFTSPGVMNGDGAVTHRLRVDPSRSMKAVTAEISELLDDMEEDQRRSSALLASELIAQVVGPAPDWNEQPIGLTIQLGRERVRLEACGPVIPELEATAHDDVVADDPVADWGPYLIDKLADRWGLAGGSERTIWAEIATPA